MVVASYQENGEKQQNFEQLLNQAFNNSDKFQIFKNYASLSKNITTEIGFSNFYVRKNTPSNLDIVITVWIVGQTLHEMKHLIEWGIYNYLYSSTNTVNLCMNVLYVSSYSISYSVMFLVRQSLAEVKTEDFWIKVLKYANDTKNQTEIYKTIYYLNSGTFIF